ncbi:GvpL/GvpF family gas vesicle protein [Streptomyces turgidiscabies]|uniref:Gas vesicle protein n=1 Tax=Streptomyces turgidiscabies TaxID=85558 RepID=A0ABU0RYE1_9ACTN|nr:hypothetical protein [Streptomyces turgidiscabies]
MTGLRYVYAVCGPFDAALRAGLTGVASAPPELLAHRGLVAVVSTVPEEDFAEEPLRRRMEDLDWLTATARAHQSVIDALTAVTTPLPLRLATVFRDDSGVRAMTEERGDDFRRALDRLDGRVEWGVKVYLEKADETDGEKGFLVGLAGLVRSHRPRISAAAAAARQDERGQVAARRDLRERIAPHPFRSRRELPTARATELRAFRCDRTECTQRRLSGGARRFRAIHRTGRPDQE